RCHNSALSKHCAYILLNGCIYTLLSTRRTERHSYVINTWPSRPAAELEATPSVPARRLSPGNPHRDSSSGRRVVLGRGPGVARPIPLPPQKDAARGAPRDEVFAALIAHFVPSLPGSSAIFWIAA